MKMNFVLLIAIATWHVLAIDARKSHWKPETNDTIILPAALLARGQTKFSLDLFQTVAKLTSRDFAVSTVDAFLGLGKLVLGAEKETGKELRSILKLPTWGGFSFSNAFRKIVDRIYRINPSVVNVTNTFLYDGGLPLTPHFKRTMTKTFRSSTSAVGENTLNNSVNGTKQAEKHQTSVNKIIAVDTDGFLLENSFTLIGRTSIKGSWVQDFAKCDKTITVKGNDRHALRKVPYMQAVAEYRYGELRRVHAKFVEIPLNPEADISMFIIRPNEATGLPELERGLTDNVLRTLFFRSKLQTVQVMLPEFKISHRINLSESLHKMGVDKIFTDDGNFGKYIDTVNAKVNSFFQQVSINGQSSGESHTCPKNIPARGDDVEPTKFKVDHPFLILIATKGKYPIILSIARCSFRQ